MGQLTAGTVSFVPKKPIYIAPKKLVFLLAISLLCYQNIHKLPIFLLLNN